MTARGPVAAGELGVTHSHEHVLWDYWNLIGSYESILDDEGVAAAELRRFAEAGGGSMVECSSVGIRVDPLALQRVSEESGVHLVLGCGFYRERVYPREVFTLTVPQLGDLLIRELTEGMGGTGVRAGLIGEIGTERGHITPAEERVFRAAARAHLATGVAILTHTTHFGELALEQVALLADAGVDPARVIISHLGDRPDTTVLRAIAKTGAYLSVDNIGYSGSGYPGDEVRADNVAMLVREGFANRVVLGTDISTKSALASFGGRGYGWLIQSFLPMLRERGVTEAQIQALTVDNIARALSPAI